jgi:hypothetical protein
LNFAVSRNFKFFNINIYHIYLNRHNLNTGGNDKMQLAALIGAYKNALKEKGDKQR